MQNVIDNEVQAPEVHAYRFEGSSIEKAQAFIDKANNRLAKAGIEDRFEAVNEVKGTFERKEGQYPFQTVQELPFWEFELNYPSIGHDGWTFVASVSFEEGGTLVNAVPGQSLVDWERPEEHVCEHCGVKRYRNRSYVLRNDETGEFMQIGSSCVVLFLGVKPALWAVDMELPEFEQDGGSYVAPRFDRDLWLAITLSVTERGAKFVSRARSGEQNGPASSDEVGQVYLPNPHLMNKNHDYKVWVEEHRAEAQRILAEEPEAIQALIEAGEGVGLDSDYGMNLAVALASETVSSRALGILTSVVGVYYREQVKEAERKANPQVQGFFGEIKERIRGLELTVVAVKYIDGMYGTTTLVVFRTAEGKTAKWFASGYKEFELGQEIVADATIKGHETYEGNDQTMITRVTVKN